MFGKRVNLLPHCPKKGIQYFMIILLTQTEKTSFTPLVYRTNGGMAGQAEIFHNKMAHMVADKTGEEYSDVMSCMQTKISFATLRRKHKF